MRSARSAPASLLPFCAPGCRADSPPLFVTSMSNATTTKSPCLLHGLSRGSAPGPRDPRKAHNGRTHGVGTVDASGDARLSKEQRRCGSRRVSARCSDSSEGAARHRCRRGAEASPSVRERRSRPGLPLFVRLGRVADSEKGSRETRSRSCSQLRSSADRQRPLPRLFAHTRKLRSWHRQPSRKRSRSSLRGAPDQ